MYQKHLSALLPPTSASAAVEQVRASPHFARFENQLLCISMSRCSCNFCQNETVVDRLSALHLPVILCVCVCVSTSV